MEKYLEMKIVALLDSNSNIDHNMLKKVKQFSFDKEKQKLLVQ